jgi:FtsP/CotA-like multicopper oxidase with cupredoxin domain
MDCGFWIVDLKDLVAAGFSLRYLRSLKTAAIWFLVFPIFLLAGQAYAETREFTLTVTDGEIELNGTKFYVWKFNNMFPGPEIRVKEGDVVKIKLKNMSSAKHGLFFHGLYVNAKVSLQEQEISVDPGYEYTYGEFIAGPPGTHLYHCSYNMAEHLSRGLFGAFIVEEAKPVPAGSKQGDESKPDKEFVYIFSDWNSKSEKGSDHLGAGHPRAMLDNDITAINDKAVTGNNPINMEAKDGERVRIRLANLGQLPHKIKFAEGFIVTHEDGYRISEPKTEDSLNIYPGKRYDIAITAKKSGKAIFYHSIEMPKSAGEKLDELESLQKHDGEHKQERSKVSADKKVIKELPILVLDVKGRK